MTAHKLIINRYREARSAYEAACANRNEMLAPFAHLLVSDDYADIEQYIELELDADMLNDCAELRRELVTAQRALLDWVNANYTKCYEFIGLSNPVRSDILQLMSSNSAAVQQRLAIRISNLFS